MASIFTKIIKGEIPSYKIAESDSCFAFLDINPLIEGHVLVVPKNEVDELFDLSESELADLMSLSKKIAVAMKKVIPCKRIGITVIGLEVPHAHIHLLPISNLDDMNFGKPKITLPSETLQEIAAKIIVAL
ncbi:MAG: histidine triad (HIT) family protein [Parvicella sp.]|jgi:histidine triad (HIT) family protein